ncbi:hypothetical protein F5Y13DRAFT_162208 [Hypoxylon sp. FL1857]|nr:hypothetical protein F5Y13DRAFT_162208 [Hypoxylon sp. FL1857]
MVSYHSLVACKAIPSQPATIIATYYGADGQLRNDIISSNSKQRLSNPDLPDEGIFILYKNRGLQIAAPPCDQRRCATSELCRCDNPQVSTQDHLACRQNQNRRRVHWPKWKPCRECLFNWLRLYPATEAANRLGMKCLKHPRTLTLMDPNDQQTFSYDSDVEDDICSNRNGTAIGSVYGKASCPAHLFGWMSDSWNDFINCGCCKTGSITALSDNEDEYDSEYYPNAEETSEEDDSDWDDLGIPCVPTSTSSQSEDEDYDFIDDIIKEEFPKSRSASSIHKESPSAVKDTIPEEEEDLPAPVIIPPKNMTIGKELKVSTELKSRYGSSTSAANPQRLNQRFAAGTKRSYLELQCCGECNPQPQAKLPRTKQRKLDIVNLGFLNRSRNQTTVYKSSSRLSSLRRKFIIS